MSIGNYLELKLLDCVFNAASFVVAADPWCSLHSAAVGETGASELSAASYARVQVPWDAAAAGAVKNTVAISWTLLPATANITDVGCWDASAAGNFLWGGALAASKATNLGDTFQIAAGSMSITLD